MALIDRKVNDWSQAVLSLDDKPKMTASDLKTAFDSNSNQLKPAINGIIDDLTSANGASNIGLTPIDGLSGSNVQAVLQAISLLIKSNDVDLESLERLFTADGASLVGLQPVSGVSASNLQQAIISLADTISKIDPYLGNPVAISQGGTGAKNYQMAIYKLGCNVRPNLFINTNFQKPVNQRGKLIYTTGKCIDMCGLDANNGGIEMSIKNDCIRIAQTSTIGGTKAQSMFISAPVDNMPLGETITISTLIRGTGMAQILFFCDSVVQGSTLSKQATNNWQLLTTTFKLPKSMTNKMVRIFLYADTNGQNRYTEYLALKCEKGENQTLAWQDTDGNWHLYQTPDYATELLKCQRYLQLYTSADKRPSKAIDCRPVMRIDPTQTTIMIGDVTYYVNNAEF